MRALHFLVTTLVLLSGLLQAQAGELGNNGGGSQPQMSRWQHQSNWSHAQTQNQSTPPVTDPNQASRISVSGTMNAHNTGFESLVVAAQTAKDAAKVCDKAHWNSVTKMCANTYWTTKYADRPVTNFNGCKVIRQHVNASCYGLNDGFANGSTRIGPFKPSLQTAAYPFKPNDGILGSVLVVRYQGVGHAVTVTDWGPAKKLQPGTKANRGIDLSRGSFESFGIRGVKDIQCAVQGVLHDVDILQCPMNAAAKAK